MNRITRRSLAGLLMAALLPAVAAAQTGADDQLLTPAGRRALLRGPTTLQVPAPPVDDPVSNGVAIGAIAGAGVGASVIAIHYAKCDESCDVLPLGPMYLTMMAMSTGIGAVSGWVIDKLHHGKHPSGSVVAPIVTKERKGVAFSIRF